MAPGRVAVVGGGIAGLATALALRQRGVAATVYERASELREVGAGIVLWPNGTRVLRDLGVLDAVRRRAGAADSVEILRSDGRRLAVLDTSRPDAPSLCVRRPDLLAALAEGVGESAIQLGRELRDVEPRRQSVALSFADGSETEADVVVAADGLRSRVRDAVFGPVAVGYRGYTVWRGIGPAPTDWPSADACEAWGDAERFGLFRLAGGQAYWYVCASRPAGQRCDDEHGQALDVVRDWHPGIAETVRQSGPVWRHDVYDRAVRGPRVRGRVVLVGDAAHGMPPDLGQGGSQALGDAASLARCLVGAGSAESALRAFAREQRRRTVPVMAQARLAAWVGQLGGRSAAVRDALTGATPSRWFASGFTSAF